MVICGRVTLAEMVTVAAGHATIMLANVAAVGNDITGNT